MKTRILKLDSVDVYRESIATAARALAGGAVVAFPTETVYGMGANADDEGAMRRLRELKDRPEDPFTRLVGSPEELCRHVAGPCELALRLVRKCWPGPLTIVLDRDDGRTVGLRMPACGAALDLVSAAGVPVAAPSANPREKAPALDAAAVIDYFDGRIEIVLDGGPVPIGLASTVVHVSGDRFDIVRRGALAEADLMQAVNATVLFVCSGNTCRSPIAEGLAKQMLGRRLAIAVEELAAHGHTIISAGTLGFQGTPASDLGVEILAEMGVDISAHRTRPVTSALLRRVDRIYCMSREHVNTVAMLEPDAAGRCWLLVPDGVADPVGGSRRDYETCVAVIRGALEEIIKEL